MEICCIVSSVHFESYHVTDETEPLKEWGIPVSGQSDTRDIVVNLWLSSTFETERSEGDQISEDILFPKLNGGSFFDGGSFAEADTLIPGRLTPLNAENGNRSKAHNEVQSGRILTLSVYPRVIYDWFVNIEITESNQTNSVWTTFAFAESAILTR